jgi:hypothetical protein
MSVLAVAALAGYLIVIALGLFFGLRAAKII